MTSSLGARALLLHALLVLLAGCSNGRGSVQEGSEVAAPSAAQTFTVGGAVSGLNGTGLVLQLNGGADLPIASDGPFNFGARLPSGGTYSVVVRSQPTNPSQTCTVANGSGSIAQSNVGSITVTCTAGQFSVGGVVTGLAGSGLVLQNNEGDPLAINANGPFTFAAPLARGAAYNITVRTQPQGQSCAVRNAAGVANANVSNVEVSCASGRVTIGGNVVGLSGSGLVLQLNGANDLAILASGRFAFATGVAPNASYLVSVRTQPRSPSQTCTVTNDRGAAAADVSNVLVSCTTNQFTVGGAVAGLAGAGLALRLNGANELAVASNGAFTFQTPLESGAEYRVAVSSQPANPAQVCTVANGEGVVGAANVTGVRVTCASNTFSIGGVVNGLLGRGLVLQNNGEDPISVDGSGAFTFPRELAAGAGYNVTVRTQPSDPQQTCSVANGRGVVSGSDVTNIAVSCSASEFTIGGVVRGLLGSGLRLRNGDEHLRIEDNGPFTFETPVPNGVRYDVRVEREPRRPRQSCTVRNGAGVVSGANVQNIEVECADDDDDDDDD